MESARSSHRQVVPRSIYLEPDVDDLFHVPALEPRQQGLGGFPPDGGAVDPHRRQRGEGVRREVEVAETDDGQVAGHGQAARLRLHQHAVGQRVRAAEDRAGEGAELEEPGEPFPAQPEIGRRAARRTVAMSANPCFSSTDRNAAFAHFRARVVGRHQAEAPMPLGDEVLRHRLPDLLVGEADEHVDRGRREVPHLHDRDPRRDQAPAALVGMRDAGEEEAVGTPAEDGGEQRLLAGRGVARRARAAPGSRFPTTGRSAPGWTRRRPGSRSPARSRPRTGSCWRPARPPAGWGRTPCARSPAAHVSDRAGSHHLRVVEHAGDGDRGNARPAWPRRPASRCR